MASITEYLKIIDKASKPLIKVTKSINTAFTAVQNLQRSMNKVFELKLNAAKAGSQVVSLRKQLQDKLNNMKVKLKLHLTFVGSEISRLRKLLQDKLNNMKVKLKLHLTFVGSEISRLRKLLQDKLNNMKVKLKLHLTFVGSEISRLRKLLQDKLNNMKVKLRPFLTFAGSAVARLQKLIQSKLSSIKVKLGIALPSSIKGIFTSLQSQMKKLFSLSSKAKVGGGGSAGASGGKKGGLLSSFKSLAPAALVNNVKAGFNYFDEYMNSVTRLQAINDGSHTTSELQDKVFASANRSRSSYKEIVGAVGRLGVSSSFSSNDEVIGFTELMQKSLKAGGTNPADQQSAMNKMVDVMSTGQLAGGDFKELLQAAPMLGEALQSFTGKSSKELMEMANQGQISAQTIKDAMFASADQINEKFKTAPVTFSELFNSAMTEIVQAVGPSVEKISSLISQAFESGKLDFFINGIATGFNMVANIVEWAITLIVENIDIVKNILTALGIVALAVGAYFLFTWLSALLPLLLIAAAIFFILSVLNVFGVSTEQVLGFVAGLFMALVAVVWNVIAVIANIFMDIAEFIMNVFSDPIFYIESLFYNLAMMVGKQLYNMLLGAEDFAGGFMKTILEAINGVLKGFNWLSDKLKSLTGIDLGQADLLDVDNQHALSDKVKGFMDRLEEPTTNKKVFDFDDSKLKTLDIKDQFDKGYKFGSNAFSKSSKDKSTEPDYSQFIGKGGYNESIGNVDRVGEVGKINESVDISSEDIKMMRELAELKNLQNFVSLTPSIHFGDTYVRKDSDINTIVAKITDKMNQDIATSVDAVYR